MAGIREQARAAAAQRILYLPHAIRQMVRPDRQITPTEVQKIVLEGELIEEYPENVRGPSCLLLGFGEGRRPIHVVCAPKEGYLAVITAYLPDPDQWEPDFKRRK